MRTKSIRFSRFSFNRREFSFKCRLVTDPSKNDVLGDDRDVDRLAVDVIFSENIADIFGVLETRSSLEAEFKHLFFAAFLLMDQLKGRVSGVAYRSDRDCT